MGGTASPWRMASDLPERPCPALFATPSTPAVSGSGASCAGWVVDPVVMFSMDQPAGIMPADESLASGVAMPAHPSGKIGGHAGIERVPR